MSSRGGNFVATSQL